MKILVHFEFDDKQIDDMTRMVRSHGDHQLVRVMEEEEGPKCEDTLRKDSYKSRYKQSLH